MFAVLHIPDFALQAVLRTEGKEARQAAALFADHTKKSLVVDVNPAARAAGVEIGMNASQAMARCPRLLIRTRRADAEADARAALLAVAFTVSPSVEATAPGMCTIDLRGVDPQRQDTAVGAAVAQLAQLGFAATAGIAPTPLIALFAARKVALSGSAPDTAFRVADGTAFVAALPVAVAHPSPSLAAVLQRWGIRTLGELTAVSRDGIGRRLGAEGLELWDRATGGSPRPLDPVIPAQTFAATLDFEEPIETLEPLLFVLRRFLERLTLELTTAGYVAETLDLAITLGDDQKHERSFRIPEPTADFEILLRMLQTYLESLRTDASIVGVSLVATPARPLVRQQGLFDTGLRDPHGFAETLARISAIVGADRVGTPKLEDTHRPDSFKMVPPTPVIPPPPEPPLHPLTGVPLRRFRPPLSARLELLEGKPTYLWTERFSAAIVQVRGPWLASGEWWDPSRAWRRTEYDVTLATGGIYRLVRSDRQWTVEGEYD